VASDDPSSSDSQAAEAIGDQEEPDASLDGWRSDNPAIWQPPTGRVAQGFGVPTQRLMRHSAFHRKLIRTPLLRRRPASLQQFGPRVPWGWRPPVDARRGIRILRLSLAASVVVGVAGVGVLADAYYQSFRIYQDAKGVLPLLATAADDLAQGRVPPEDSISDAIALTGRARRRVDDARVTFRIAGFIPYFGRPVRAVQHAVAAGENEAQAAELMRDLVRDVLGGQASAQAGEDGSGRAAPVFRKGRLDVELLGAIVPRLEDAAEHVRRADAEIRAIPSLPFLGHLDRLKADALDASEQAVTMAEEALAGARLLPSLLGAQGDRTYLLVLQDGSRLRASGGTAIAYGFVRAAGGRLTLVELGQIGDLDDADADLSPDFPVSAAAWTGLAAEATGRQADGAIALDAVALSYILEGREVRVASYPRGISSGNVVQVIGGSHSLGPLARQALAGQVLAAAWGLISDPDPLVPTIKQLGRALREKHVQVWSERAPDQPLLDALGWDGGLDLPPGDHLLVVQTNLARNGLDLYTRLEIEYDVAVLDSGDIRSSCLIKLINDAPDGLPASIAGGGERYALSRAQVALHAPGLATLERADPPNGAPAHEEGGAKVFLRTIGVPAGKTGVVRFDYAVPGAVRSADQGRTYRLTLQKQPTVTPARLTVRVTFPSGTKVRSAPGWTVMGNVATLDLTLTRDRVTEIVF
jgi:hypothetical protein